MEEAKSEHNTNILRISSDDRDLKQSINRSNFLVYVNERNTTQNVERMSVKELMLPNNFYNVRDGTNGYQNNTLKILETSYAVGTITIPQGQYAITELLPVLQALINTYLTAGTVALTLGTYDKKITFTFTGTTAIIYNEEDGSTCAEVLGITTTSTATASFEAQALPDLSGLRMVYCQSQDLAMSNGIDASFGHIATVECVSFWNVPFGAYGYTRNSEESLSTIYYARKKNINKISLSLRDKKGNRLDIGTGEMTITLKIYH